VHVANAQLSGGRHRRLDADVEGSLFSWASSSVTFMAGSLALVLALIDRRHRVSFAVLALVLAFFSLDDTVVVHEHLGEKLAEVLGLPSFYQRTFWVLLYLPILVIGLGLLLELTRRVPASVRNALRVGIAFLAGAVLAELISTLLFAGGTTIGSWPDTIEVAIEEGLELAGWILISAALAAAAVRLLPNVLPPAET